MWILICNWKLRGLVLQRTAEVEHISSLIYLGFYLGVVSKRILFNWLVRTGITRIFGYFNRQVFPVAHRMSSYAFSIPQLKIKYITTKRPRSSYKFGDIRNEFVSTLQVKAVEQLRRDGWTGSQMDECKRPQGGGQSDWLLLPLHVCNNWAERVHWVNPSKLFFWFFFKRKNDQNLELRGTPRSSARSGPCAPIARRAPLRPRNPARAGTGSARQQPNAGGFSVPRRVLLVSSFLIDTISPSGSSKGLRVRRSPRPGKPAPAPGSVCRALGGSTYVPLAAAFSCPENSGCWSSSRDFWGRVFRRGLSASFPR